MYHFNVKALVYCTAAAQKHLVSEKTYADAAFFPLFYLKFDFIAWRIAFLFIIYHLDEIGMT